jgi:hypothetical protein
MRGGERVRVVGTVAGEQIGATVARASISTRYVATRR